VKYTTTLAALRESNAYEIDYNLIANHVGRDFTGEINLLTILEVSSPQDCIWAIRAAVGGVMLSAEFAIRVAYPFGSQDWKLWADKWLSGKDRSRESASAFGVTYADAISAPFAFAPDNVRAHALYSAYASVTANAAAVSAAIGAAADASFFASNTAAYADVAVFAAGGFEAQPAERARQVEILTKLLTD